MTSAAVFASPLPAPYCASSSASGVQPIRRLGFRSDRHPSGAPCGLIRRGRGLGRIASAARRGRRQPRGEGWGSCRHPHNPAIAAREITVTALHNAGLFQFAARAEVNFSQGPAARCDGGEDAGFFLFGGHLGLSRSGWPECLAAEKEYVLDCGHCQHLSQTIFTDGAASETPKVRTTK